MSRKTVVVMSVVAFLAIVVWIAAIGTALAAQTKTVAQFKLERGESTLTFDVPKLAEEYSVQITNGSNGGDRVSSASITLNGIPLFNPKDFNQEVGSLTAKLAADVIRLADNELSYKVSSRPGSFLQVVILGVYKEPEMIAYYRDADGDGYGAPAPVILLPAGTPPPPSPILRGVPQYTWVTRGGDCNDMNPLVFPGQGCAPLP